MDDACTALARHLTCHRSNVTDRFQQPSWELQATGLAALDENRPHRLAVAGVGGDFGAELGGEHGRQRQGQR